MARQFLIANGPMPTTAPIAAITTGVATKTMLQVQAGQPFDVIGWGVSFTTTPAVMVTCELIDTAAVAATALTAHVAAGVVPFGPDQTASSVVLGTGATGYNLTTCTEGTPTSVRIGDIQQLLGNQYFPLSPLGREFYVPSAHNLRVRMTTATAVLATCFVLIEE